MERLNNSKNMERAIYFSRKEINMWDISAKAKSTAKDYILFIKKL